MDSLLSCLVRRGQGRFVCFAYPFDGKESLCHAQLESVLKGRNVLDIGCFNILVLFLSSIYTYLHSRVVYIVGKVSITYLERRRGIIDERPTDDVVSRNNVLSFGIVVFSEIL